VAILLVAGALAWSLGSTPPAIAETLSSGLLAAVERTRGWGWPGALALSLLYIPAGIFLIPGTPITFATSFTFGFAVSLPCIILGSNLGAIAAFVAGRTVLRTSVERRLAARPRAHAMLAAVDVGGLRLLVLLRLSPLIPFNLLNVALGTTRVPLARYALGTFLGMLPGNVLYCAAGASLGSLAAALAGEADLGTPGKILLGIGALATVMAAFGIGRAARRATEKASG